MTFNSSFCSSALLDSMPFLKCVKKINIDYVEHGCAVLGIFCIENTVVLENVRVFVF